MPFQLSRTCANRLRTTRRPGVTYTAGLSLQQAGVFLSTSLRRVIARRGNLVTYAYIVRLVIYRDLLLQTIVRLDLEAFL